MKSIEVEFTKIVGEGKSLGRKDGKVVFSYGVLPGEVALINVIKEKRNFIEGEVIEIKQKSCYRQDPVEEHYLSCSPWQIIKYEKQVEFKRKLIEDLFFQTVKEPLKLDKFYSATDIYSYRTKIEYSFSKFDNLISLSFYKRGDYSRKVSVGRGCKLIDDKANEVANKVVYELNKKNIDPLILKSIIVRSSKRYPLTTSALFVKDRNIEFKPDIENFSLVYSNPVSSISSVDEVVYVSGNNYVVEKIGKKNFEYGFDCFFQNNIDLFEIAISEIKNNIRGLRLLDLYCGVGVIGLSLSDELKEVILVESNRSSTEWAKKNALINDVKNVKVINVEGEKLDADFFDVDSIVVDPPRQGLHKNVIKNILKRLPERLLYLSCNPITCGRDLNFLLERYKIISIMGFDFYPNTPHIETLVVCERK